MAFKLKQLLARGPETIQAEKVFIKEIPLEELGFTFFFILIAGFWLVFSADIVDWIMGVRINSPTVQTLRGINFVTTTSLVLYLVLRRTLSRRRKAEEALRLSQQRFESVALATTDAIWELNLDTKVVWWNEGIQKLFGYRPEDVSSKFDWWLQRVHPDDRDRVTASIHRVVESGAKSWTGEYRFRKQDNNYATVLDRGFIVRDAAGKPLRLVGGITDISERRLAEKALEGSRQQLRALAARLQSSREDERAKVAREIHDELGQTLTALKLNLDWLEGKIAQREHDAMLNPLLDRVVESGAITETAIESVQRISADLRPALLDNLGLFAALKEEASRFQQRSGIRCEVELPSEQLTVPPETATAVFRVFQEALTNVARHAQAAASRISLTIHKGQIILKIEDDGVGIRREAIGERRSLGLLGMNERAAALGGSIDIEPLTPHGTRVTLRLPQATHS